MARAERSRKNESTILQALAMRGQAEVAKFMDVSETKISRMKNEDVAEIADFLTALDLKAVPVNMQCYHPDHIQALLHLAKAHLAEIESPDQLQWPEG